MAFQYTPFVDPYRASIGELLLRHGDIAAHAAETIGAANARAAELSGQAYGNAFHGIGQAVSGAIVDATDPRRQLDQMKVDEARQLQQGRKSVDTMMQGDQLAPNDAGPRQESYLTADGLFDIPKMNQALSGRGMAHLAPELLKGAETINDSITKHQETETRLAKEHSIMLGDLANGAYQLTKAGTPILDAMDFAVQPALATKRIDPKEYAQVRDHIAQMPPEQQQAALTSLMDQAAKLGGEKTLAEGATEVDRYGRPIAKGATKPTRPVVVGPGAIAVDPETGVTVATGPARPPTAEEDKARYIKVTSDRQLGKTITPEDAAFAKSYEQEKTLNVDRSASAAATRLASVQAQQNALQLRAQNFNEAQAGRKELTEKASLPYLDAVEKAETLRSVIAAADAGNQEAAALTPLLATLGVTTSEGVKRINMAEIATVKGAGSLYQRIKGKIGGVVNGQPLSADLKQDIKQLADLLESSARTKYERNGASIIKTYGLKDELIPKPEAALATSQPIKVGAFTVVVK